MSEGLSRREWLSREWTEGKKREEGKGGNLRVFITPCYVYVPTLCNAKKNFSPFSHWILFLFRTQLYYTPRNEGEEGRPLYRCQVVKHDVTRERKDWGVSVYLSSLCDGQIRAPPSIFFLLLFTLGGRLQKHFLQAKRGGRPNPKREGM